MELSGWGRYPRIACNLAAPRDLQGLKERLSDGPAIARGNGRSYGDSALNRGNTLSMRHFNHMLGFDAQTGQLTAEAGVLLGDIIDAFLPRGWFPAVTPGTKFVTLGGMIAADVHGKNHHLHGSFRSCVDWIDLLTGEGEVLRCSPSENPELFEWTIGGMGLTGIVLRAAIRLIRVESGWIRQRTLPAENLRAAIACFEAAAQSTYSVAWIDCLSKGQALGRSLVMTGEHVSFNELPADLRGDPFYVRPKRTRRVPFDLPTGVLNSVTVRAFNTLYYRNGQRQQAERLVGWDSFFYPLDAVLDWNRIYGRKGFVQFQCVLPLDSSEPGLTALLTEISTAGQGSFLAVLKRMGPQAGGFSFPMEGYTLALDFPATPRALALMDRLYRITIDHGGRFYLVKDGRLDADTFKQADDRADAFAEMRARTGCAAHFKSAQSERLEL